MERFGATGIGIGKDEGSGGHVISVYLETVDQFPSEQVVVDEVPLRFVVTGPIKPLEER